MNKYEFAGFDSETKKTNVNSKDKYSHLWKIINGKENSSMKKAKKKLKKYNKIIKKLSSEQKALKKEVSVLKDEVKALKKVIYDKKIDELINSDNILERQRLVKEVISMEERL